MKQIRLPLNGSPAPLPLRQQAPRLIHPASSPALPPHPADELARINALLLDLLDQRDRLQSELINAPADARTGRLNGAIVERHTVRTFDKALMPRVLRECPRFYREEHSTSVRVEKLVPLFPDSIDAPFLPFLPPVPSARQITLVEAF